MTVFKVLAEMIGSEKLLGLVALPELMLLTEMFRTHIPIGWVWKFLAAITAHVKGSRMDVRWVESRRNPTECSAGPRMLA
jgi:hypothetical protein